MHALALPASLIFSLETRLEAIMLIMIVPVLCVGAIFIFLCAAELLWRMRIIRGESSRKFVHIIIGSFVAFWPFLMSWRAIQFISIAFLAVIIISRQFHVFQAIHNVRRKTWGEILFAVSIGLLPFFSSSRLVFAAAVLHMSLADGLAGLIGTKYGDGSRFSMFGQAKSLLGSLTFAAVSYAIVLGFFKASRLAGLDDINWVVIMLPILATLLETASVKGTDNIVVPLLVAQVLNSAIQ